MLAPATDRHDRARPTTSRGRIRWLTGALVLVGALVAYLGYRRLTGDASLATRAHRNAGSVVGVQERLGIDVEAAVQGSLLGHGPVGALLATVYGLAYWPAVVAGFVVAAARDRSALRRVAWAFAVSGLVGLIVIAVFPVAPPRLDGTLTDQLAGTRLGSIAHPSGWFHPYAAMPSFHVAWTALAAAAMRPTLGRVALALPMLMSVAVVTTGNHWILDVVAGWVLASAAWAGAPRIDTAAIRGLERGVARRRSRRMDPAAYSRRDGT